MDSMERCGVGRGGGASGSSSLPPSSSLSAPLQFESLVSAVDVSFWHELSRRKLHEWRLSEEPVPLHARYAAGSHAGLPPRLFLEHDAFQNTRPPHYYFEAPGQLLNTNTIESFKAIDKSKHFNSVASQIWADITSGEALRRPSLLNRFLVITYSDLKKYKFYYMFAFPALFPTEPVGAEPPKPIEQVFEKDQILSLCKNYEALRKIDRSGSAAAALPEEEAQGFFLVKKTAHGLATGLLADHEQFWKDSAEDNRFVGLADPSAMATNPGWPLRNFVMLLSATICKGWDRVRVICYREHPGKDSINHSIVLTIHLPRTLEGWKSAGWEKDKDQKLRARVVSLAASMDPKRLAGSAVDLNLQLMRWRLMPSLNLQMIADQKCLLLGSGTLGCNVARALLGWGVRNITMVDNGTVSFSNPVRQSLFLFEDCLNGGKPKGVAAAERLAQIFPGVNAQGRALNIPMPGHPVPSGELEKVRKDYQELEALVTSHDVVFLLMDSRESRWLPSMLAAVHGKLVINSALGFDTLVVMRHGVWDRTTDVPVEGRTLHSPMLAKYVQSLSDRTLDQQCTVTRPGVSFLAASMAVELFISVLHHPLGAKAPADLDKDLSSSTDSALGLVPHQIRGFLSHFKNMLIHGHAYERCTACSDMIVNEYKKRGFDFLLEVFARPQCLEDLTGLTALKKASSEVSIEWEPVEGEDDFDV